MFSLSLSFSCCHLSFPATYCSARKGDKERKDVLFCCEETVWINGEERCLCQVLAIEVFCSVTLGVLWRERKKSVEICNHTHFPSVTFMRLASSVLAPNVFLHIFPALVLCSLFHFVQIALCSAPSSSYC